MKAKRVEVKSEKKSKKKFIFMLLAVFIVFFLAGFYLTKNKEEPLTAESYTIDQDSVDSITTVTQKGYLSDIVPVQENGSNIIEYVYKNEPDSEDTVNEYVNYLMEEKGFVELKDEDAENSENQENQENQENTNNQENAEGPEIREISSDNISPLGMNNSDNSENMENTDNAGTSEDMSGGMVFEERPVLKYGIDSQEENKIFEIDIRYGEKYYYVDVYRKEGTIPKEEEEEGEQASAFTRDDAREYLKEFINSTHALNGTFDEYTNIFDVGRTIVNNEECYGVSLYRKGPSGYNYIVGKYFISLENKDIFRYNLQTGDSVKIN